jgi:purine-binding chemotaxis protein CheW
MRASLQAGQGNSSTSSPGTQVLTVRLAGQLCGLPVPMIRDVLGPQPLARIPLAPPEVAGSLNLRGRIITAIDLRRRLGLPPFEKGVEKAMSVVMELGGELYSFLVDDVGDVITLPGTGWETNPSTLDSIWRQVSQGVQRLDNELLVVLDAAELIILK